MNEKFCKKCEIKGLCCYHSVLLRGKDGTRYNVILKNHPCKFLDIETRKCLIYDNRFILNPYCVEIEQAVRQQCLPGECLYLKLKKYEKYDKSHPKLDHIPAGVKLIDIKKYLWAENMEPAEFRKSYLPLLS